MRDLYARMFLTRAVDNCLWQLNKLEQGRYNHVVSTCRGYEAAQIGSALCIAVGKDFTLPYYRDLGVVLTIGMTPYEVLRSYVQAANRRRSAEKEIAQHDVLLIQNMQPIPHWGYSKHNMVAGSAPVSTQILHAAGIAFACKLRKGFALTAVTIAYCGDSATAEPDFLEGITFAALHQLPVVFVCEQDSFSSSLPDLPVGLEYHAIDGIDVIAVYLAMQAAMQHVREGLGPVILELNVQRQSPDSPSSEENSRSDPLISYQKYLEKWNIWDQEWAVQLRERLSNDVEQAMQEVLRELAIE